MRLVISQNRSSTVNEMNDPLKSAKIERLRLLGFLEPQKSPSAQPHFYAYGPSTWSAETESCDDEAYPFQGVRFDSIAQPYDFGNGDFSPAVAPWAQAEPLGYVDGPNLYPAPDSGSRT
jgi:hypothetical protein